MMDVTFVTPAFFDRERGLIGGGERYVRELSRAMAKRANVRVVTFGPKREDVDVDGVRVEYHRSPIRSKSRTNPLPVGLARSLRDARIIHCHQLFSLSSDLALLRARSQEQPVFATDHGGAGWNLHRRMRLSRYVAGHLAVSKFAMTLITDLEAPKEVVYAGVNTSVFRPLGIPHERKVVCVGRIAPHKGQADVIRAIPPGVPLEIYGPIIDLGYYRKLVELSKGKDVTFVHDADTDAVVRAYNSASVTVQASVMRTEDGRDVPATELFGLTLAESMACGTPVVATRAGSLPEVVGDDGAGLIVNPGDPADLRAKLLTLLDAPDEVARMGKLGRARVERCFTWDRVAQRCLVAYAKYPARG